MNKNLALLLLAIFVAVLAACGGGGSTPLPPQQSVRLTFGLYSSAGPAVETFRITAQLPAGVQPRGLTPSPTNPRVFFINYTGLTPQNGDLVLGTYSSTVRLVQITGGKAGGFFSTPHTSSFGAGLADVAALNCSIAAGTPALGAGNFSATMLGGTLAGGSTSLAPVLSALGVVFNY